MPRKRHVSRNESVNVEKQASHVMPRKRHVSRNALDWEMKAWNYDVMPRKRHVSRNAVVVPVRSPLFGHASQEACE